MDTIAGLDEFGDVADPVLASATQPSVAIKVLDKRHNALYVWSLDRMQQQLQRMRNLTTFIDRPSYTQHFSSDEPFYDSPTPTYSFIGNALISLAPLCRRLPSTFVVPIFSRYTAEAIGSCRIDIRITTVTPPTRHATGSVTSARPSSPLPDALVSGSKVTFVLSIDTVKGLSTHDFSSTHLQVRLSSFVGPSLASEEVYPSSVIDLDRSTVSELKFRRTFSVVVTSRVLTHFRQGYAPVEFFAAVKPMYLERIDRWDDLREQKPTFPGPSASSSSNNSPSSLVASLPLMRRSETDFVMEQTHNVAAWVQICELSPAGGYEPVPLVSQGDHDPGCFSVHQGLQRRIFITMSSDSGQQLPWSEVTKVRIGNVRLLDAKGRTHDSTSKSVVMLPLLKTQTREFKPDGTGNLTCEAVWDSSVHDSPLLNTVTGSSQRVLLQLTWAVAAETCGLPIQFSMDIAISMQTRDARPPSKFLSFFGQNRILQKSSTVFNVRLYPSLTRSTQDLWRLDTSEKYVRGEEALGVWRPRGVSVVDDYENLVRTERKAANVQAIRVILHMFPPKVGPSETLAWKGEELVKKCLDLWQRHFEHRAQVLARCALITLIADML